MQIYQDRQEIPDKDGEKEIMVTAKQYLAEERQRKNEERTSERRRKQRETALNQRTGSSVDIAQQKFAEMNTRAGFETKPSDVKIVNNKVVQVKYTKTIPEQKVITQQPKSVMPTNAEFLGYRLEQTRQEQNLRRSSGITPLQQSYLTSTGYFEQKRENIKTSFTIFNKKTDLPYIPNSENSFLINLDNKAIKGINIAKDYSIGVGSSIAQTPAFLGSVYQQANLFAVSPKERVSGLKGTPAVLGAMGVGIAKNPKEFSQDILAGIIIGKGITYTGSKVGLIKTSSVSEIEGLQLRKSGLEDTRKVLILENKPINKVNKQISDIDIKINQKTDILQSFNIEQQRKLDIKSSKAPNFIERAIRDIKLKKEAKKSNYNQAQKTYGTFEYDAESIPLLKKTESGNLVKVGSLNEPIQTFNIEGQPTGLQRQLSPKDIDVYDDFVVKRIQEKGFKKSSNEKQTALFANEKIEIFKKTESGELVKTNEINNQKPLFVNLGGIPITDIKFKSTFGTPTDIKITSIETPKFDSNGFNYKYFNTNPTKLRTFGTPSTDIININAQNKVSLTAQIPDTSKMFKSIQITPQKREQFTVNDIISGQRKISKQSQIQQTKQETRQILSFSKVSIEQTRIKTPLKTQSKYSFEFKQPKRPFFMLPLQDKSRKIKSYGPLKIGKSYSFKEPKSRRLVIPDLLNVSITEARTGKEAISPKLTKSVRKRAYGLFTGTDISGFIPTEQQRRKARL